MKAPEEYAAELNDSDECAFLACRLPEAGALDAKADDVAMHIPLCIQHVMLVQLLEQYGADATVVVGWCLAMSDQESTVNAAIQLLDMQKADVVEALGEFYVREATSG